MPLGKPMPPGRRCVIGVDLGGTKTAAGIVDDTGMLHATEFRPTPATAGAAAILATAVGLVSSLLAAARAAGLDPVAVGIGSAGVIDARDGSVASATDSLTGWAGTPLAAHLSEQAGLPAYAVNDVHAHNLGEHWKGASAGSASSLLVAVGTGVGGSLILAGEPHLGARAVAGHVGHLASPRAYDDGGRALPCSCGRAGHVEAIASGPSIALLYQRLTGAAVSAGTVSAETVSGRDVASRAAAGDTVAMRALAIGAAAAGQAVGGLANVLDPSIVVIGGGVTAAGDLWWTPFRTALRAELMDPLAGLPVVPAALDSGAALVGAAKLAFDRLASASTAPPLENSHA
ncbi:ROK family protein [Arthrobacter sp. zg-Y820]|uniref:ROK family protein n=1 Tax=unclassified Arthrobacter TaxID=235627 RepID=UPI001E60BF3C|nr:MULTISPECIES: ROK family protein [unclassified Arthrobacter]MCC9195257.1 ROK family protein [Arthrobacter sp. zg-Y820]MDK1278116.1 ROK family protein [Arthrobacter sp. zg.Y820]WIB10006.1 ROK family protein [Arthrobacter sp. zg-Y820]